MANDDAVTNTEQLEQQNPGMKTKLKLKQLKDQVIVIKRFKRNRSCHCENGS